MSLIPPFSNNNKEKDCQPLLVLLPCHNCDLSLHLFIYWFMHHTPLQHARMPPSCQIKFQEPAVLSPLIGDEYETLVNAPSGVR